jgi:hypothetical protein
MSMMRSGPALELEVVTDGNVVLTERLTRALRDELDDLEGVEVVFAPLAPPATTGVKGTDAVGNLALWVFLGTATKAAAQVMIEQIRAWAARERGRAVRITRGNQSIQIPGDPDEAQERLVARFLESPWS